ncbi:MAG: oligoendopeptidase F [Deltaproteobacteria bacterium]|nr:oligoendopeptidase F [Deltaproteobacteria bacterium]
MAKGSVERAKLAKDQQWNTSHLFRSDKAWARERTDLAASMEGLSAFRGGLAKGEPTFVASCLQLAFDLQRRLARLASYAARKNDQDTRVPAYQAMREVADKTVVELKEASAFIEPELLRLSAKKLRVLTEDERLADYDAFLRELIRRKAHVLSPKEEALLASTSLMGDAGYNAYATFSGAELKFPTITDERGKEVQLTQSLFSRYRTSPDRGVRKAAFDALFSTYGGYQSTFAALLSAQVNGHIVFAKARRYGGALEAALDADALPVTVYQRMIDTMAEFRPLLHRYLRLRGKLLGLRQLRYYDLYVPMVEQVRLRYPYAKSRELLVGALEKMGPRYTRDLHRSLDPRKGWVDPFPTKGKRSGAYMDGSAYDVHPYVLCNTLDDYNSLSTLAHEMGHAMHSFYSNKAQPFAKADYTIFVAEVASTLNETLLSRHVIGQQKNRKKRLFLLGELLESFRQTMFRQAMFAEFELSMVQHAESGQALTGQWLSKRYLEVARATYGHDEGVVKIDEAYGCEWAYVPHFYYDFYVFQYVTGMTAAVAFAELIEREGPAARDRYIAHMLEGGCAKPPLEILADAGVDLTSREPYVIAMGAFERALDEMEELVG